MKTPVKHQTMLYQSHACPVAKSDGEDNLSGGDNDEVDVQQDNVQNVNETVKILTL